MIKKDKLTRTTGIILMFSILMQSTACAVHPPLKDSEWIYLEKEEKRPFFENVLEESDKPTLHLTVTYIAIGGLVAFLGLGVAFDKKTNPLYSWLAFLSSAGLVWGGSGALIQKNYYKQRKRIATRELAILEHPEWRGDKVRAIRNGRIDVGFEDLMVTAAWSDPQIVRYNVEFNGELFEEWTYFIKKNTKVYINIDRKVAVIQTPQMTYQRRAAERVKEE